MNKPKPGQLLSDELPASVRAELTEAKRILEHQGIVDRLTEILGAPMTASLRMLPQPAEDAVRAAIDKSLSIALDLALKTLGDRPSDLAEPKRLQHKLWAGVTGAAGGALGGVTVALELPISTVLILRSVADIARSEGENLAELETRLACLEVLAFDPSRVTPSRAASTAEQGGIEKSGGTGEDEAAGQIDDQTEVGYFAVRAAMAKQIHDASRYVLKHQVIDASAPPLVRLIGHIGRRFGVVVSQKLAAQAIPVIGAVGGALINSYFIDHYQGLARAHFAVRRLERTYGEALIREAYYAIRTK